VEDKSLAETIIKMRTLFFFLHDLDEDYENQAGPVRAIVDGWFARRLNSTHDLQAAGILPLLQAKTVVWFLFPVLSARRDHALPSEPPQTWDVTIRPKNAEPATVDVQLRIMRNTLAHMLEEKPGATTIDLDAWTLRRAMALCHSELLTVSLHACLIYSIRRAQAQFLLKGQADS
jgi:hypothetical protein